jgi:uncharacterized protein
VKLVDAVTVARPPDEVFAQLSDAERIAPFVPGVVLEGREGDEHIGRIAVRVGPISATYRGRLRFVRSDGRERRTLVRARGEELNGHGSAEATILTAVEPAPQGSRVVVETDLRLCGRVARLAPGAIGPIAARMLTQLAENLERVPTATAEPPAVPAADGAAAAEAAPAAASRLRPPGAGAHERFLVHAACAALALAVACGVLKRRLREPRRAR